MKPDDDAPQLENAPDRSNGQAVERAQEASGKEFTPAGLASGLSDPAMQPVSDENAGDVLAQHHRRFERQAKGEIPARGHAVASRKGAR